MFGACPQACISCHTIGPSERRWQPGPARVLPIAIIAVASLHCMATIASAQVLQLLQRHQPDSGSMGPMSDRMADASLAEALRWLYIARRDLPAPVFGVSAAPAGG